MSRPIYKQMLALHKRMKAEGCVTPSFRESLFNQAIHERDAHWEKISKEIQAYIVNNASILKTSPEILVRDMKDMLKNA